MSETLTTLLSSPAPPPFIHLHHPHHPAAYAVPPLPARCVLARVDAIEHHSPRLLFSGILHRVSEALGAGVAGEVTTWDGFARALRDMWDHRDGRRRMNGSATAKGPGTGKGKGKETDKLANGNGHALGNGHENGVVEIGGVDEERTVVVVVTKAERLRTVLGAGWAVMTRLAELTGVPACVVLASTIPWDELRPARADALEPINVYLPPLTREDTLRHLLPASDHPLWPRFLDLLLATLSSLLPSSPPIELAHLASALWPIYTSSLPPHIEQLSLARPYPDPSDPPPPLGITVKLLTDLKSSMAIPLAAAAESLIPRLTGAVQFTEALLPRPGDMAGMGLAKRSVPRPPPLEVPMVGKYLLVAAYCGSYNPAKTDLRLFGRAVGPDGKKKKGGGTRRAGYGRVRMGKVPQRLLGPKPFPLDRLLALFAALYAEHAERPPDLQPFPDDYESDDSMDGESPLDTNGNRGGSWLVSAEERKRRDDKRKARDNEVEERWEDEVWHLTMSVKLWGMIPELEAEGLLRRISPMDRLDNVMLRSEIDYEAAKTLARELKINLDEYLYEAVM